MRLFFKNNYQPLLVVLHVLLGISLALCSYASAEKNRDKNEAIEKVIELSKLNSAIPFNSQQTLVIPITLEPNQFLVLLLNSYAIEVKILVQSPQKKILAEGQFKDLYRRQRLLINSHKCKQCRIVIHGIGAGDGNIKGELNIATNIYSSVDQPERLIAEQHLEKAFRYQKELLEDAFKKSLFYYEKAIEQWLKIKDREELKNTYFLAGDSASGLSIHEKRPDLFSEIISIAVDDKDYYAAAIAYIHLGRDEYTQGRYNKAQEHFQHSLYYAKKNPDLIQWQKNYLLGYIHHQLGQLTTQRSQYQKSLEHLKRSLEYFKNAKDTQQQAAVLNTMGLLARRKNELQLASQYHRQAYTLAARDDHGGFRMRTLYYMAVVNAIRGRYFYALELLKKANKIAITLNTIHWQGHILAAQARINMELGRLEESLELYQKTRKLYQNVQAEGDLITVSLNLGKLYSKLGDYQKSHFHFSRALEFPHEKTTDQHKLNLYTAEVSSYIKQKKYTQALDSQINILNLAKTSKDKFYIDRNLAQLAEIYIALGQSEKALDILQKVLSHQEENRDDLSYTHSNYLAAQASLKLKSPRNEVLAYINRAITTIENIRSTLLRDDLRQQYFALQKTYYELKTMLYLDTSQESHYQPQMGLISAESFKARTLYENLLESNLLNRDNGNFPKRTQKATTPNISQNIYTFNEEEERLIEESFREFLEKKSSSENSVLTAIDTADLKDYRENLPLQKAIIYFFTTEQQSILWLMSKEQLKEVRLPPESELNHHIKSLLEELAILPTTKLSNKVWQQQHQQRQNLSQIILGDIAEDLKNYNELLIIPDGPLHKVPFSALYNPKTQIPLLVNNTITYGVSIATQQQLQRETPVDYKTGTLLLVANPHQIKVEPLFENGHSITRNAELRPLPYVQKEVNTIAKFWQKYGDIDALVGNKANKRAIYDTALEQYEILHFATHALVNWDYPSLSAISLAPNPQQEHTLTGKDLTVQDISQWHINAELVVLSGCDTASGKTLSGEGPLGLSRAFFKAGGKRVIASIWPVEDEATAFLMEDFYRQLFINKYTPAKALQQARLNLSKISKWSHPYYWAGFLFLGNGEHWREF
ncbi:CHAT domain-containing protein [Agarilytica rhodophyticola]|uniref:CHAT domain-containing protein n=1 Tax=Agarilytica rhodophyticola TaxID=1737490 RepID=UPI000B343815|nr:CHAT domain-containing protein [Agarilytica rhodophyticola]